MNAFLHEHSGQESPTFGHSLYDWQAPADGLVSSGQLPASSPAAPFHNMPNMHSGYPEHEFSITPGSQFTPNFGPSFAQRQPFQMMPQVVDHPVDYRRSSPHSAPPSGGNSPWNTGSITTQEVMYHPDVDVSKFNRGSRGSMNSLSLASMRTSHPLSSNGHAYTPTVGARPHGLSVSIVNSNDEQPWNLIPYSMPFAQDNANGSAAIPGMAGGSFFLRSPTPTKRQRTNQACEKCRERKAKCNGARPTCQRCAARGHICEYAKERRMRGPNKTGRRGSQAGIEDLADSPGRAVTSLEPEGSESANQRDDSPASSRPGSRRSSSEAGQGESASGPQSSSGSPEPHMRAPTSGPSAPIALPTLSNGNLSLAQYPMGPAVDRYAGDAPHSMPSESVIRYAQSMPHLGYRFGQPHNGFLPEEASIGVWGAAVDGQAIPSLNVPGTLVRGEEPLRSEYPTTDMQPLHYSVSDVSSSSTPLTPDRFEYTWPSADVSSPQQHGFQFGHNDKHQSMSSTLPEFDSESNSLGELRVWSTESPSDNTAILMPSGAENEQ